MNKKPLVGISSCLLGENVRYDGGHQLNHYLADTLGQYVDFVPVCPEYECGMSIPREAMRLVIKGNDIRLLTRKSKEDMTGQMLNWMPDKLNELSTLKLCGFVFKSKSPSSGLFRVKVYNEKGAIQKSGSGVFAKGFTEKFPFLPVEEDGRMMDSKLRENFIERLYAMQKWHEINTPDKSLSDLINYHARHKYILMSHCPETLKELGALIGDSKGQPLDCLFHTYFEKFITALKKLATKRKNTNVLQHIMGYFKKDLKADEKTELLEIINNYYLGLVPQIVPITILNHYVRKYKYEYLKQQLYLNPHPMELMLRNHV